MTPEPGGKTGKNSREATGAHHPNAEDRDLGMNRRIARRDFLNGMAYTAAALAAQAATPWGAGAARSASASLPAGTSPPAATGLTGQTANANAVMHAVRDGVLKAKTGASTGETFDLVVVGAGLSGLAAAHEYRRLHPSARILLLDPLADVGGHAARNEFRVGGRQIIGYGGSQSLQTPSFFSPAVNAMLQGVGIEPQKFRGYYDAHWYDKRGLGPGVYFSKELYGRAATVRTAERAADWVGATPLNARAKAGLTELSDHPRDYLNGLSAAQKREKLAHQSYRDFLLNTARVDPQLALYFQDSTREYYGGGSDVVSALDAWANGNPGFAGMALGDQPDRAMSPTSRLLKTDPDEYIYHFPDGNASVARALVGSLIPQALPLKTGPGNVQSRMEGLVTAKMNYAQLDVKGRPVRIRLNSTAVHVRHLGDPASASQVEVVYAGAQGMHSVVAGQVILACWHRVIPYLTDELKASQVTALRDQVKIPLVYANVVIRNFQAFERLKLSAITSPGGFWIGADLDFPVSMGQYRFAQKASDPVILHLRRIPGGVPGTPGRDQFNAGRQELTRLTLSDYEREARRLLGDALGGGGFDPARDIAAITVNRWAHGYAYEYMRPDDAYWPTGPLPIAAARKGWGRIAVANSDSGAYAYAHSAIDQGVRAARELTGSATPGPAFSDFPGPPQSKLKFFPSG